MACIISSLFIRNYAAAIAVSFPTRFLGPLGPRAGPNTTLISKPNCFIGNKLAQIWAQSQFSPDFAHPHPAAMRCYLTGKPECPSSAPPSSGGTNFQTKPYDKGGSIFGCREGSFFGCHLQPHPMAPEMPQDGQLGFG